MAATEKELAEHLATIRADISALTKTLSQLASETGEIRRTLGQRIGDAARSAVHTGERVLSGAGRLGGEAMHAVERGAVGAVTEVQEEIERNPFTAVLVAAGVGFAIGLLSGGNFHRAPPPPSWRHRF